MPLSPHIISNALFQSLIEEPQLLTDLPEAAAFPSESLAPPTNAIALNLEQKLGHLYEDALSVVLESTPRYRILEQSLQIREKSCRTLGELDFLIRDLVSGQLIQLELAVKFYLAVKTGDRILLPGPDARDNYYRKLEKMRSHQLMLVKKFQDLLPENFRRETITVQQMVHGCIFNHVSIGKPLETDFLNPNGRRGKWLHAEECPDYFGKNTMLEIIPKPLWPASLQIMKNLTLKPWYPNEPIDRCVMVRAVTEQGNDNTPYFIAPNRYPDLH